MDILQQIFPVILKIISTKCGNWLKYKSYKLRINVVRCCGVKIFRIIVQYGKYPKISYTKVSDKVAYANSEGPDQTAPEGAV